MHRYCYPIVMMVRYPIQYRRLIQHVDIRKYLYSSIRWIESSIIPVKKDGSLSLIPMATAMMNICVTCIFRQEACLYSDRIEGILRKTTAEKRRWSCLLISISMYLLKVSDAGKMVQKCVFIKCRLSGDQQHCKAEYNSECK